MKEKPILEVKNLKTYFYSDSGTVKAADDVSFEVYRRDAGHRRESGCGKSITCMSIVRLIENPRQMKAAKSFSMDRHHEGVKKAIMRSAATRFP